MQRVALVSKGQKAMLHVVSAHEVIYHGDRTVLVTQCASAAVCCECASAADSTATLILIRTVFYRRAKRSDHTKGLTLATSDGCMVPWAE